jgi:hydroxymethylbilane synthase
MRGNLQTRIAKMDAGDCDALMLAYAGVKRMEYDDMIIKVFSEEEFIPPVGQGCIAIESAKSLDAEKRAKVRSCLNNADSEACLLAERAFLRVMEGGCSIPAFGLAKLEGDTLSLQGGLSSLDGSTVLVRTETGSRAEAEEIGKRLGMYILENGGKEILADIERVQG